MTMNEVNKSFRVDFSMNNGSTYVMYFNGIRFEELAHRLKSGEVLKASDWSTAVIYSRNGSSMAYDQHAATFISDGRMIGLT